MAQTTFSISMESDTQKALGELCAEIGMSMSAVFSIFAKKAVSERRIPFFLTSDAASEQEVSINKRIGAAKGRLSVPKEFDDWDKEVEELFGEGVLI